MFFLRTGCPRRGAKLHYRAEYNKEMEGGKERKEEEMRGKGKPEKRAQRIELTESTPLRLVETLSLEKS